MSHQLHRPYMALAGLLAVTALIPVMQAGAQTQQQMQQLPIGTQALLRLQRRGAVEPLAMLDLAKKTDYQAAYKEAQNTYVEPPADWKMPAWESKNANKWVVQAQMALTILKTDTAQLNNENLVSMDYAGSQEHQDDYYIRTAKIIQTENQFLQKSVAVINPVGENFSKFFADNLPDLANRCKPVTVTIDESAPDPAEIKKVSDLEDGLLACMEKSRTIKKGIPPSTIFRDQVMYGDEIPGVLWNKKLADDVGAAIGALHGYLVQMQQVIIENGYFRVGEKPTLQAILPAGKKVLPIAPGAP